MIVDEFGGDEGFKDDELLFYEWLTVKASGKVHLIWQRGEWRFSNSKLKILAAPHANGSIFRSPSPPLVVKVSEPLS